MSQIRAYYIAYVFFGLSLFAIISNSCSKKKAPLQTVVEETPAADTLPQDFQDFYDRFHSDSLYQLDHIVFPLEGLPHSTGDGDTTDITKRFFWQRDGWKKHNHFNDPSGQFEHWYEVKGDRVVEHFLQIKGTKIVMHRRFAKLDDEWYLIYYSGMREREE